MTRVFSLMICVMLFLAVEHSVQAADSITEVALPENGSSSREDLAAVVTQLVTSVMSMKVDLQKTELKLQKTELKLQKTELKLQKTEQILQKTTTDLQRTKLQLHKTERNFQKTTLDLQKTELKLQKTEQILQKTTTDLQRTKLQLHKTERNFQKTTLDLQRTELQLQEKLNAAQNKWRNLNHGSTFVRWGRKTCPDNTILVYSGVAGGKEWNQKGSGTNRLCLTRSPQFDNTPVPNTYGYLYGAEYQSIGTHHDYDVPCSVCRTPHTTTIMIPATHACPWGWIDQYKGYLTAARHDESATEYSCLDRFSVNDYSGGRKNENGLLFYHVITVCGSLPCPPYEHKKVVLCVVCSR